MCPNIYFFKDFNSMFELLIIILMLLGGHALGKTISRLFHRPDNQFLKHLLEGNFLLNFIFISLFVLFGLYSNNVSEFFMGFFISLLLLAALEFYFSAQYIKSIIYRIRIGGFKSISLNRIKLNYSSVPILCVFLLAVSLLIFHSTVIYYHPILNEYDSIYVFLPISKSILLGNGLNHDFYGGSDISIRYPPFVQVLNAWIIDLFDDSTLRIFPIYFVILISLTIFMIIRNLGRDNFLSMIGVCITLATPALLVISSRFSLQQDLSFIAFATFSMYGFLKIIKSNNISRFDFAIFIVSLSFLPLVREIGLILSWFLFFFFLTLKFSKNRMSIRICFTILSLLPLYALTLNDMRSVGLTPILLIRLSTLIIGNIIIYFLRLRSIESIKISSILKYLPIFALFAIPASFIISNFFVMNGPYPTLSFSTEFSNSLNEYRYIFDIENKLYQNPLDSLQQIPRIDLLFFSIALGSVFFLFKFKGIIDLIRNIRLHKDFPNVLIAYLVIISIIWSYLLSSGFTEAGIRHIAYFIPIFSIIITLAFSRNSVWHRIYIFSMIVFSLYYYLQYDLAITNQNGHFYAMWIDPKISPYIGYMGLITGGALFIGFLLIDFVQSRRKQNLVNSKVKYITLVFPIIFAFGCYFLLSANLQLSSESIDIFSLNRPWENDVFEVIYFLKYADEGSVLSVRAPAISYFSNRTNFDVYNPHIFSRVVLPILNSSDGISLEKKLLDLNIKYIILPNGDNPSYTIVNNIEDRYKFQQKLQSSHNFSTIPLKHYTVYKLNGPKSPVDDLLGSQYQWQEHGLKLLNNDSSFLLLSETMSNQTQFNRMYLNMDIPSSDKPLMMVINYSSGIVNGNASFIFEIRESSSEKVLYSYSLKDTHQKGQIQYLLLPAKVTGKDIELRFYIITNEPGKSYLKLTEAKISTL